MPFELPKEQRKKNKKSAAKAGPSGSEHSMDIDPEEGAQPIPVVVGSPRDDSNAGSASDSGTNDDVPGDIVTETIWRNAKGGFKEFRPECFEHCRQGGIQGIPPRML